MEPELNIENFKNAFTLIENVRSNLQNLFNKYYKETDINFVEVENVDAVHDGHFFISLKRYFKTKGTAGCTLISIPYKMILGEMTESEIEEYFNKLV